MATTLPSDPVVELGKKLVSQLDLENSVDTLARWMSHHIASLIQEVESASGEERRAKEKECREAILELWKVRHEMPNGRRPLESFEGIFRALASFDPADSTPRYYRASRPPRNDLGQESDETAQWLELVEGFDYSARVLMRYCLTRAAETAVDKSREWVELAGKLNSTRDDDDLRVLQVIIREADMTKKPNLEEAARKLMEDRLNRLKGFLRLAGLVSQELEQRLAKPSRPKRSKSLAKPRRKKTKRSEVSPAKPTRAKKSRSH
jgi:hypothetical protein